MIGMRCFWWTQKTKTLHGENTNKGLIVFNLVTWKCDLLTLDFWHCYHSVSFVSRPRRLGKALAMTCADVCVGCVDMREYTQSKRKLLEDNVDRRRDEGDFIAQAKQWAIKGQSSLSFWAQKWPRCGCCHPAAVSNQHWIPLCNQSGNQYTNSCSGNNV